MRRRTYAAVAIALLGATHAVAGEATPLELAQRPIESFHEFAPWLEDLQEALDARGDRRAVLITMYRATTEAFLDRLDTGFFADDEWVSAMGLNFARLYQKAFVNDALGNLDAVPRAWRVAFRAARSDSVTVFQHALLGAHAHINHDLTLALAYTGLNDRRRARRHDHFAGNAFFDDVIAQIESEIANRYSPALGHLDTAAGPLDEIALGIVLRAWRYRAWRMALVWSRARTDERRQFIERILDLGAGLQAERFAGR